MVKRSLTGGTGDVNPQILTMPTVNGTSLGGVSWFSVTQALPFNRLPIAKGKSWVMEVLKVWFVHDLSSLLPPLTTSAGYLIQKLLLYPGGPLGSVVASSSPTPAAVSMANPNVIAGSGVSVNGMNPVATSNYAMFCQKINEVDLTDGDGHGVLVATDTISLTLAQEITAAGGTVPSCQCKILYRVKAVSLQEYIGIVQAQSSS